MKTVVLGGYGNFGTRICRALADCPDIELVVAGRDAGKAAALAAQLGGHAVSLRLDLFCADLAACLREAGAGLVIHTAGPFQAQGYGVALAAAAAGAHYIDLADGRAFVCDFAAATDAFFRGNGRLAVTGASTVPALSSAVVDFLVQGWDAIDAIDICIAPAQTAPRGLATMTSVLDCCGAPIQVWQDARWTTQYGWEKMTRIDFSRMDSRLGALCDIPDLQLFPSRYRGVRTVMFRAALEVGLGQRALSWLAWLRRKSLLAQPRRLAALLNLAGQALDPFGSSLGGMVVRVRGRDAAGETAQRAWHIAADHDHGPEIPCMTAIILARRLAAGNLPQVGAHTSMGWLDLADFQPEFARWGMLTDVVEEVASTGA